MTPHTPETHRAATGISGLDLILRGGLPKDMVYLVHGGPGSGKTTLGFQFLLEGVRRGERVFYASLLQDRTELETVLNSHGWSLEGIDLLELPENFEAVGTEEQTLFDSDEIELPEMTGLIREAVRQHKPQRMVFDSITELAALVGSSRQLRRMLLQIKTQLGKLNCTTLFTVTDNEGVDLPTLRTVVHGIIELGVQRLAYNMPRRWLEITKMRGMSYLEGSHDFRIRTGGLKIFPCIEIFRDRVPSGWQTVSSGNAELDTMFGGGLETGTACLITGTTGAGKSTLSTLYVQAAAARGERCVIFCFDERRETFLRRARGLELGIDPYIEKGLIDVRQIDVGSITPGQFAYELCRMIDREHIKVVVLDTINGYFHALPEQHQLMVQLHEMLSYTGNAGVLTLLVVAIHGLSRETGWSEIDTSYIADTVVLLRNFEASGQIRRCISVLKKRHGDHEKTIREFCIEQGGLKVGEPLFHFRGILSGNPVYFGDKQLLLQEE